MIKFYENKQFHGYICLDFDAVMVSNLFNLELSYNQSQIYSILPRDKIIDAITLLKEKNISYYVYENNVIADQHITLTDKYKTYLAKIQDSLKDYHTNLTELAKMLSLNRHIRQINNETIPKLLEGRHILPTLQEKEKIETRNSNSKQHTSNPPPENNNIPNKNNATRNTSDIPKRQPLPHSTKTLNNKIKPKINSVVTYKQNNTTFVQKILPVRVIEEPIWVYDRKKRRTLTYIKKTISDADGKNSIACTTPIAQALMQHGINESFSYKDNYGKISTITILSIK